MTNCRDRFALFKKMAGKLDRVFVGAQRVRVHQAAGNHQRIEVIRSRVVQCKINIEFVALVGVMHALILPDLSGTIFVSAPASSSPWSGFGISTFLKPFLPRIATFFPSSFL